MSDQLKTCSPQRHALLFELIRQRAMAKFINQKGRVPRQPDPAEFQHFISQAEQSFSSEGRSQPTL